MTSSGSSCLVAGVMTGCTARVFLVTENAVFWCDQAYSEAVSQNVINGLRQFEGEMVPLLRDTFGSEASPGIDNDPRFHVLFTARIGDGYNGYFSAEDSADPRLRPNSNGMELVFLHTKLINQGFTAVIDTLSHEFQHMIHYAYDPNEIQQEKLCFCMICGKKNPEGKHNWRTVTEGDYTNIRICTNCGERDESKKITLKEKAEKEAEAQSRYKEAMINADSLHEMRAHGIKC